MRPINAEALKASMVNDGLTMMLLGKKYELSDAMKTVDRAPTIALELKKGHWIEYPECLAYADVLESNYIVCSECKAPFNTMENEAERFDFCPVCGARMVE